MIVEILFWTSLGLMIYSYCLYPLTIYLSLRWRGPIRQSRQKNGVSPAVSVLISAFDEEGVLEERLFNLKQIDYPGEKMEFLIGSDGSPDGTNKILREAESQSVRP